MHAHIFVEQGTVLKTLTMPEREVWAFYNQKKKIQIAKSKTASLFALRLQKSKLGKAK